jgi:hypothetical protein
VYRASVRGASRAWLVLAACQTGVSTTLHFHDATGTPLPQLERVVPRLSAFFGETLPASIEVDRRAGNSKFDANGTTIHVSTTSNQPELELVAHETTHLALARLTGGANLREQLRFIDEGFANVMQHEVDDTAASYRATARAAAAARAPLALAPLEVWSTYFGHGDAHPDWIAYDVAASFVLCVRERYGEARWHDLLADLAVTGALDASLQRVLHVDRATIEQQWNACVATD